MAIICLCALCDLCGENGFQEPSKIGYLKYHHNEYLVLLEALFMREIELKKVCGNCQWVVPNVTEDPYCTFDGHFIKPSDEECSKYLFNFQLKHSLENIDAIEAESLRHMEMLKKGQAPSNNYDFR